MPDDLGTRIRAARKAKRMSLRALATAIGVSPSLLSQVETGKTKPSVSTLYALISHLGIAADTLLGREEFSRDELAPTPPPAVEVAVDGADQAVTTPATSGLRITREQEYPTIEMENGVRWEKLAVLDSGDVEALRVTYQPQASSSIEGHMMRHLGVEHFYLVSGELTLRLEFDTHVIRAGDSAVFDSQRPHLFVNQAQTPAVGVWYMVGRKTALNDPAAVAESSNAGAINGELKTAVDVLHTFRG